MENKRDKIPNGVKKMKKTTDKIIFVFIHPKTIAILSQIQTTKRSSGGKKEAIPIPVATYLNSTPIDLNMYDRTKNPATMTNITFELLSFILK